MALKRADQCFAPCAVEPAHAADMALQMSFAHEVVESFLFEDWGVPVLKPLHSGDGLHQGGWSDHIADAEAWKHYLGECSYVDDGNIGFQTLQRRQGRAAVAVFAGIVVFHKYGSGAFCPGDQLEPGAEGHRNTG